MKKLRFKGFNDNWQEFELGNIGKIITGNTPSTLIKENYQDNGFLWVTPTDISKNIIDKSSKTLSLIGKKIARVAPKNSILVTCIASIGKNALLIQEGAFNQQINALIPSENFYPYFLIQDSFNWSKTMEKLSTNGLMQIINKDEFSKLKTKIPSLQEQEKIGELFKNLDESINKTELKISKLKQSKKALLDKLFTKTYEIYPKLRFKGFNDNWQEFELGNIVNIIKGEQVNNSDLNSTGLYPFINGGVEPSGFYDMYNTKAFTITISEGGNSCGYVNFIAKNFWSGGHCYTLENLKCNVLFLFSYLKNIEKQLMNLRLGSGLPNIQKKSLSELLLKLPNLQEQEKIGELFKNLDESINLYEKKLNKLKQIKLALLDKVFKGE